MLKVHGVHGSPYVRKVLITLELKGLEYEMVTQMPFIGDEDYKKLNPLGKIPTLVDGDLTLGDSKVICRYLESAYPDVPFYPADLADEGIAKSDPSTITWKPNKDEQKMPRFRKKPKNKETKGD